MLLLLLLDPSSVAATVFINIKCALYMALLAAGCHCQTIIGIRSCCWLLPAAEYYVTIILYKLYTTHECSCQQQQQRDLYTIWWVCFPTFCSGVCVEGRKEGRKEKKWQGKGRHSQKESLDALSLSPIVVATAVVDNVGIIILCG